MRGASETAGSSTTRINRGEGAWLAEVIPSFRTMALVCSIDRIESAHGPYLCRIYSGGNRIRAHVGRVKLARFEKNKKERREESATTST